MKGLLISTALVLAAGAAHGESLKSAIKKYDATIDNMMMKKDFEGMKKVMRAGSTPDFQYVENSPGHPLNVDQMADHLKMGLSSFQKITTVDSHLVSLKHTGKTATGVSIYSMGGIIMGQDKKPHKMLSSGKATNTYVKTASGWKVSKMVWGDDKMTLDGKPMAMPSH